VTTEASSTRLNYTTYLRLPELLGLQSARSTPEHPDELHFIATHQAIELCFKVLAADVRRARDLIDADQLAEAVVVVRRARVLVGATVAQLATLELMPPEAFHRFRQYLGTASGLESVQFRELEILSGVRTAEYQSRLSGIHGGQLPASLVTALAEPSLADAHLAAGVRYGVKDWADFYTDAGRDPMLEVLTSALLDYDDAWRHWRSEHVALVLRMLGDAVMGTAGTDSGYLTRRVYLRFFPHLWAARSEYAVRVGGRSSPADPHEA